MRRFQEDLRFVPALLAAIAVIGITGCPIRQLTGISCAGCGMTRAWLRLLTLQWEAAFACHPLVLAPAVFVVFHILRRFGHEKLANWVNAVLVLLFVAVYLIRILNPQDTIVTFAPQDGLIWRTVSAIIWGNKL